MPAPEGNQFWKARTKHGRDKLFANSECLWEACCEYFEWVEENPLFESKLFSYQGAISEGVIPKMRAMTISGLCLFLDIDRSTWTAWKTDEGFSTIISRVEEVIYSQKFAGAAADLLNPNIIARELGLKDANTHEVSGPNGGPIEHSMTLAEANDLLKEAGIDPDSV
ncbi:DNA-packaging protein [Microbulbifer epialgicus]|uniref:DNA-packaging protein n=1 Tax=Microbulbifer epialgicus TaxID=393907 RepID=A0ABV4P5Q6_9GAMM